MDNRNDKIMRDRDIFYVKAVELVALLALGLAVLGAMGCSAGRKTVSSETVSSVEVKRDSSAAVRTDTVWRDRFVERIVERVKKEATSVKDSTVFTVDKEGNVIKAEHWRGEKTRESSEETERLRDSAAMWKARYEALLVVKADSVVGVKTVKNTEKKGGVPLVYIIMGGLYVAAAGTVVVTAISLWAARKESKGDN